MKTIKSYYNLNKHVLRANLHKGTLNEIEKHIIAQLIDRLDDNTKIKLE